MSEVDILRAEQNLQSAIRAARIAPAPGNQTQQGQQKTQEAIINAQINLVQVLFDNGRISEQEAKSYIDQLTAQKDQNNTAGTQNSSTSQGGTPRGQERSQVEEFLILEQGINKMRGSSAYG